ncbi:hypothetical protein BCO9919_02483 [Burkholderia cenocepacia]|uniref:Uncharacterized protein n=1 Tax=Burkholderia cenocepacia TaxID=95486 RepID=A0A6J5J5H2_9BURK|nr:hypothetical protein BCO9919_02483 [Burkholderia cenocepacia]
MRVTLRFRFCSAPLAWATCRAPGRTGVVT